MQSYLVLLRLCFCMYRSRKTSDFEKKHTYEKTNGGPMKRPSLDFVGYEMTNGGPVKIP